MTEARTTGSPTGDLEDAAAAYRAAQEAVEEVGEADLQRLAEACREFNNLLDSYEGQATGSGDFAAYTEFEGQVFEFVEELPDGLPRREAFERAADYFDKRRLSPADFERAREEIVPAQELASRLDDRAAALERYRGVRHDVVGRRHEITARIDHLEEALSFADVDFDAPVGELREAVEAYDNAVRSAFDDFLSGASAREVLRFVETTVAYPLVTFPSPPAPLEAYLLDDPAGEESVTRLLDFAGYSDSKLDHYVEDPASFGEAVVANRAYLRRLDAEPLTVGWPPPPADELRWQVRELIPLVARFAQESVVSRLRDLREFAGEADRYARLRRAALARETLDSDERARLKSGEAEEELDRLREAYRRLGAALDEYPER